MNTQYLEVAPSEGRKPLREGRAGAIGGSPVDGDPVRKQNSAMTPIALRRSVMLAGAILILMIVGAGGFEAWQDYRTSLAQSERGIAALSRALGEQTARMVQETDFVLSEFADWKASTVGFTASDVATVRRRLRTQMARLPFVVSAGVIGVDGRVQLSTRDGLISDSNLSDEEVFSGPRRPGADGLYASAPRVGRHDGYVTFALSRSMHDATGRFSGVVAARVGFDYLSRFYAAVDTAPDAAVRLVRDDGVVLSRYSPGSSSVSVDPFGIQSIVGSGLDGVQCVIGRDGTPGLLVRRRIEGYPMSIEVAQPMSSVMAIWRSQQLASAVRSGILALFAGLLLWALGSALRRRERSEEARIRLEGQLRDAQQAETLGLFAASIAHDFNNVLAAIVGYAELARNKLPGDSPASGNLDRLLAAGERARSLVQRVLTFDSRRGMRNTSIAIEPIVSEVLDQVRATLPAGISVKSEGMEEPGRMICGDSTEVHQVIMNLCSNAVHAMPAGGTLELRLETVSVRVDRELNVGTLHPGHWLCLTVADRGNGMTPDQVRAIFEPFFTTKGRGYGTGLGLAVVRNVVTSMGGAVSVTSRRGKGTSFQIYWPLIAAAPPLPVRARVEPVSGHGQTIMVVDDEESLVAVAEELLAGLGYEPVGFTDPKHALATFQQDPARFDAILSDERMPLMRGSELAKAAHDVRGNLPIVLVTGHRDEGLSARAETARVAEILDKPLHLEQLDRVLAHLLRRPSAPKPSVLLQNI